MHAVVSSPLRCAVMAIMRAILKTPTRWRRLSENPILQNRYPIMVKCLNIGKNIDISVDLYCVSCSNWLVFWLWLHLVLFVVSVWGQLQPFSFCWVCLALSKCITLDLPVISHTLAALTDNALVNWLLSVIPLRPQWELSMINCHFICILFAQ